MQQQFITGERQRDVLAFISHFILVNGYSPSYREIGSGTGLSSTATVSYYVNRLIRQGKLARGRRGSARALVAPQRGRRGESA